MSSLGGTSDGLIAGRSGRHEATFFSQPAVQQALDGLREGPITIVVGAGASAEVGFPLWGELLDHTGAKLAETLAADGPAEHRALFRAIAEEDNVLRRADLLEQAALNRVQFVEALRGGLYAKVDKWVRPGPTVRAVARLYWSLNPEFDNAENSPCHLATTNFDLLIELALREQRDVLAQQYESHPGWNPKFAYSHIGKDPDSSKDAPLVRHLHGYLEDPRTNVINHSGRDNKVIVTGTDFLHRGGNQAWHTEFLTERLGQDHLLIVGASLSDLHLLEGLLRGATSDDRRVVAIVPRPVQTGKEDDLWAGHDPVELQMEAVTAEVWQSHYGITALFPDWYHQVGQFIEELRQLRVNPGSYVGYEERLASWFGWFKPNRVFGSENDRDATGFRLRQAWWNQVMRAFVVARPGADAATSAAAAQTIGLIERTHVDEPASEDSGQAEKLGGLLDWVQEITHEKAPGDIARETGECLVVHFWTRIPNHDDPAAVRHREIAMTAASDRIWQHPGSVDTRRITHPTRRTAVDAFIRGYQVIRHTNDRDHQWNFIVANAVRLPESDGAAPLTIGVITIESSLPWTYLNGNAGGHSPYGGADLMVNGDRLTPYETLADGRQAPVTVLRLCHELWKAGDSTNPEPLDKFISQVARSAGRLSDPNPRPES